MKRFIASCGFLGFLPRRLRGSDIGAGTLGAAVGAGIGVALLVADARWWWSGIVALAAIAIAIWAAAPFSEDRGDPGWVCIDEVAGTLVALVGLSGWPWVAALVVSRLADIFKVLPGVRLVEERLPGAVGVAGDDVVAGLYGLAVGWLLTAVG